MESIKHMINEELFQEEKQEKDISATEEKIPNFMKPINYNNIFEAMEDLGKTQEDVEEALIQLAQNSSYEEKVSLVKDIYVIFKTPKVISTDAIFTLLENEINSSMNRFQFKLGLYNLASVLKEYNGTNLDELCGKQISDYSDDEEYEQKLIECKATWIEKNIALPIHQLIADKALKFQQFIFWIGTPEVFDFLKK